MKDEAFLSELRLNLSSLWEATNFLSFQSWLPAGVGCLTLSSSSEIIPNSTAHLYQSTEITLSRMKSILKGHHFPETQWRWICSQDIMKKAKAETQRSWCQSPKTLAQVSQDAESRPRSNVGGKVQKLGQMGSACEKQNPTARGGEDRADAHCCRSQWVPHCSLVSRTASVQNPCVARGRTLADKTKALRKGRSQSSFWLKDWKYLLRLLAAWFPERCGKQLLL